VRMTARENKRSAWEAWRLRRFSRTEAHPALSLGVAPCFLSILQRTRYVYAVSRGRRRMPFLFLNLRDQI
jgi:hypothetical protein